MSKAKISLLRVVIDVSADHWMVVTVVKQWLQLGVAWTYLKRSIRQLDTLSVDWHASRHLQLPFPTVLTLQDSVHGITIASKTVRISTRTTTKSRSGSLPPPPGSRSQSSASGSSGASPNTSLNSNSTSNLTTYPWREVYHKMSYILVSTDDFHRGPTRISTIDPYLHEKVPFTVIKDSLYFQVCNLSNPVQGKIRFTVNLNAITGRASVRPAWPLLEVSRGRRTSSRAEQTTRSWLQSAHRYQFIGFV